MTKSYNRQKNLLIFLILSTLFLFISSVSLYIYNSEKKHFNLMDSEKLDLEVELLGSYLSDLIARHDYAELKNYLNMVVEKNNEITYLKINLKNNKELFSYDKDITPLFQSREFTTGEQSFTVSISHETIALEKHLSQLKIFLLFFVIIFTTIAGFTLWYILSRWILRPLNNEITKKTKEIKEFSNYLNSIINSLNSHIAIVDKRGNIIRTNRAWENFAKEHEYIGESLLLEKNYLQQCDLNHANEHYNECENGVTQVLTGKKDSFLGVYACHSPNERRWFNLRANRFYSNQEAYTVISHEDITNVKLIQEELEKLNRSFSALSESNMALIEAKTEDELLNKVVETIFSTSHYLLVWIGYKVDDKEKTIQVMATSDENSDYLDAIKIKWSDCEAGRGPAGTSIREKKVVIVNDIQTDENYKPWRDAALKRGFKSSSAFPIFYKKHIFGVLNVYSPNVNSFIEEEIKLLEKLANNLAYGIISLRNKKQIELLSITDQLTGAYNRRKIEEVLSSEIEKFKRYNGPLALMMLDIDHFKLVNDTHGHQIGDTVLVKITNIINNTIRTTDVLGRWGGEEFILILPNANIESATILAQRIRQNIENFDFDIAGRQTASIGLCLFLESDNQNSIIARIDKALYEAKENGRNQVVAK